MLTLVLTVVLAFARGASAQIADGAGRSAAIVYPIDYTGVSASPTVTTTVVTTVGSCTCDLTEGACDANCCCDTTDCSVRASTVSVSFEVTARNPRKCTTRRILNHEHPNVADDTSALECPAFVRHRVLEKETRI